MKLRQFGYVFQHSAVGFFTRNTSPRTRALIKAAFDSNPDCSYIVGNRACSSAEKFMEQRKIAGLSFAGRPPRPLQVVFFQFSILSLLVEIFQTITGIVAHSTIHRLNTPAFSDLNRKAIAATISRLYLSTMFPFRQRVRRQTRSSTKTPLLSIARIFAFTAAAKTPNKSAIRLYESQTPVVVE